MFMIRAGRAEVGPAATYVLGSQGLAAPVGLGYVFRAWKHAPSGHLKTRDSRRVRLGGLVRRGGGRSMAPQPILLLMV